MQFITTDQRIAVENFEVGMIYTVTFSNGNNFTGSCIGIGPDFVAFQRTAPELLFCLTMAAAADVASIDPLGSDIGKILEYTGSVPVSIKTNGSPLLEYTIKGNDIPGTGDKTANLFDISQVITNSRVINQGSSLKVMIPSTSTGVTAATPNTLQDYCPTLNIGDEVTLSFETTGSTKYIYLFGENITWASGQSKTITATMLSSVIIWYASGTDTEAVISNIMLNLGSTAKPYEPFGVKIPILSGDTTTNIYLDNPLRKSLDGTAVDELSSNGKLTQRVDTDGSVLSTPIISYIDMPTIPTSNGLNVFDISTTVKPSEVYIKYFSPLL